MARRLLPRLSSLLIIVLSLISLIDSFMLLVLSAIDMPIELILVVSSHLVLHLLVVVCLIVPVLLGVLLGHASAVLSCTHLLVQNDAYWSLVNIGVDGHALKFK